MEEIQEHCRSNTVEQSYASSKTPESAYDETCSSSTPVDCSEDHRRSANEAKKAVCHGSFSPVLTEVLNNPCTEKTAAESSSATCFPRKERKRSEKINAGLRTTCERQWYTPCFLRPSGQSDFRSAINNWATHHSGQGYRVADRPFGYVVIQESQLAVGNYLYESSWAKHLLLAPF